MSYQTQVDLRTLREFYPDPNLRHLVHYVFAHRFLPGFVRHDPARLFNYLFRRDTPGGAADPTQFIRSLWAAFEQQMGPVDPALNGTEHRRVSDLTMSLHTVADRPVAVVQMPHPEALCEAYFIGAAALVSSVDPRNWTPNLQVRVFTLESEDPNDSFPPDTGVFCEWLKDEHRNFDALYPAQTGAFLQAVAAALRNPDAPARAAFKPPGTVTFDASGF